MKHVFLAGIEQPVSNIFCIGRNFAAHAAELGNRVENEPLVFIKPTSALSLETQTIILPSYSKDVHHECEIVVLIGRGGDNLTEERALEHVAGYGIGLDLTARDMQTIEKEKGHPWSRSKCFRHAACVSGFVPADQVKKPQSLTFDLHVNGDLRQHGDAGLMLFPIARIISHLSTVYGLNAGDLIYTGTPQGVAQLHPGDRLQLDLHGLVRAEFEIAV